VLPSGILSEMAGCAQHELDFCEASGARCLHARDGGLHGASHGGNLMHVLAYLSRGAQ
jgi:hypothetical protein